jgi:CRISPR/Cas system type I-B associated protein Csh2 (Cas7 group RAMP superfamily)
VNDKEVLIRKYKQLSASKIDKEFELIALNENWADIRVSGEVIGKLIGPVIFLNRVLKQ